jgi:hypothetical protein
MGKIQPTRRTLAVGASCVILGGLVAVGFTALGGPAGDGGNANVLVQSTGAYAYTANDTIAKHFDSSVQAGDLLTVSVDWDAAGSPSGVSASDTLGNAWTLDSNEHGAASDRALAVFHAVAQSSGDDTVTVDFGADRTQRYININEYAATQPAPPTTAPPSTTAPPTTPPPTTPSPTPTPSPSASPTPSPTPTQTSDPPVKGFPDATNTGVQGGIMLQAGKCPGTITTPGVDIEGMTFSNCTIRIQASNVTLRNDQLINTQVVVWDDTDKDSNGNRPNEISGVVLDHLMVDGQGKRTGNDNSNDVAVGGGLGGGFTLSYSNITGWDTGVAINAAPANVYVHDNYIHGLGGTGSPVHKTALSANSGGGNARIIHNSLFCETSGCSAAMSLYGDFGPISGWDVENNYFSTEGSYCSYEGTLSGKKYPTASDITWTGNIYDRGTEYGNKLCGQYGPSTGWGNGNGNSWSNNTWADTGTAIPAS